MLQAMKFKNFFPPFFRRNSFKVCTWKNMHIKASWVSLQIHLQSQQPQSKKMAFLPSKWLFTKKKRRYLHKSFQFNPLYFNVLRSTLCVTWVDKIKSILMKARKKRLRNVFFLYYLVLTWKRTATWIPRKIFIFFFFSFFAFLIVSIARKAQKVEG